MPRAAEVSMQSAGPGGASQPTLCTRPSPRVSAPPPTPHPEKLYTFPVSSAQSSSGLRGGGAWALVRPPRPTPRPHLPFPFPPPPPLYPPHHRPHTPWVATPPPHVTFLTAEPPHAFSAQTLNVLIVDRPGTPRTPGNSNGSFPVSVIPSDNSNLHAVATQMQTPLVEAGSEGGNRNASRASNVLGNDRSLYPTNAPHASTYRCPHPPTPLPPLGGGGSYQPPCPPTPPHHTVPTTMPPPPPTPLSTAVVISSSTSTTVLIRKEDQLSCHHNQPFSRPG
ncbi:hypothetical protein Pcinc_024798 [Petrolisthes cinctipes]|uniref:Uncharacterized protein n=1 Tax=Petrolisthes cinctipes TaxID=88211 RepID=A0AAE1FAJ3_PETCI|nr:hypothetical protein Pcinc_024798 [Petrolisthes cinctipes]